MDQDQTSQENIAKKHRLQMDLLIKDSDLRSNNQKKAQIDVEMRTIKRKMDLLKIDIEQYNKEIDRINSEQIKITNEMKKLKEEISNI